MGYDLTWRKIDPSETAALAEARAIRDYALKARDALPKSEGGTINHDRFQAAGGDFDDQSAYDGRTERYQAATAAVLEAGRKCDAAKQSYFRLNMWGMSAFTDVMLELGMAFNTRAERPGWPQHEAYGVTVDQVEQVQYPEYSDSAAPLDEETSEKVARFLAEQDAVLAWHGEEIPGIPAHKFSSSDGWIVTPAECKAALAIYMAKLEEAGQDAMDNLIENRLGARKGKWAQWLAYLNGAISHDGFEVH